MTLLWSESLVMNTMSRYCASVKPLPISSKNIEGRAKPRWRPTVMRKVVV